MYTFRLCSTRINHFRLVGFFCVLLGKNCSQLVWLITFFNRHQTRLKWLKKYGQPPLLFMRAFQSWLWASAMLFSRNLSTWRSLVNDYSQESQCFRKWLEKWCIGKPVPFQPKPVVVERVDPKWTCPCIHLYKLLTFQSWEWDSQIFLCLTPDNFTHQWQSL